MLRYTDEQKQFLKENNYMTTAKELADMFNKKFCTNITAANIKTFRGNNHLNSGLTGRFEKGHVPNNKGKKWDDYMSKDAQERSRKTTFKKGNKPLNAVDIGQEHIRYSGSKPDDQGYLYIKVCDGKGNKNWIPKQRVIYEQYHSSIPDGHKVIFADGNRFNFDIENLVLVSSSEEFIMNQRNLRYVNQELTKTGHLIAQIIDKKNKLKK